MTLSLGEYWPAGPGLVTGRHQQLIAQPTSDTLAPEWCRLRECFPHRVTLLDLETGGLAGSHVFLSGLVRHHAGELPTAGLVVELLLARTYAEEAAVLWGTWERLAETQLVVTFNGKSFDWPTLVDRTRRHLLDRRGVLRSPAHLDVLHAARRRYKGLVPDCRLQTLERLVCRRRRVGDVASDRIPAVYDQYVRTGQAGELDGVLHHNALDLVTLLDLTMRLAE